MTLEACPKAWWRVARGADVVEPERRGDACRLAAVRPQLDLLGVAVVNLERKDGSRAKQTHPAGLNVQHVAQESVHLRRLEERPEAQVALQRTLSVERTKAVVVSTQVSVCLLKQQRTAPGTLPSGTRRACRGCANTTRGGKSRLGP